MLSAGQHWQSLNLFKTILTSKENNKETIFFKISVLHNRNESRQGESYISLEAKEAKLFVLGTNQRVRKTSMTFNDHERDTFHKTQNSLIIHFLATYPYHISH